MQDRGVGPFLAARSIAGYFLVRSDARDALETLGAGASLPLLATHEKAFDDYAITSVPFAYVVTRAGTVTARGMVGGGLRSLAALCDQAQAYQHDNDVAHVPAQAASAQRVGR